MKYRVVAISRTMGAGGDEVGQMVAEKLGFRYVDSEIIDRAAEQAGVARDTVERSEARKGLVERILENIARGSTGMHGHDPGAAALIVEATPAYEQIIAGVIHETANQGNVVIVAHGASIPLAGRPDLLRVMVTAPVEVRMARYATSPRISEGEARKAIADSDKAREDYFRRFYNLDRELPTHYDLVVNTEALSSEQAVNAVLAVARG
jgi:cytidylate kinase